MTLLVHRGEAKPGAVKQSVSKTSTAAGSGLSDKDAGSNGSI
jgi:hypothetical protein